MQDRATIEAAARRVMERKFGAAGLVSDDNVRLLADDTERAELIEHMRAEHGLIGYDPFPLGVDPGHDHETDSAGNVLVSNVEAGDLANLRCMHAEEGAHGPRTHTHDREG